MNKDEILKKSRQQKNDEGMEHAENSGRKFGFAAFTFVFIFILIFSFFMGIQNYAIFALYWTFIAAESIPKYRFTNNKTYLIIAIAGFIAAIAFLLRFLMVSVR